MKNESAPTALNHPVLRGALAGIIATIPMTWAIRELDTTPDDELIANMVRKAGYPLDGDDRRIATYVSRFGFGAFAGIVYALAAPRLVKIRPEISGPLFGIALWGASVITHKSQAKFRLTGHQQAVMVGSHLTWGYAVTRLMKMTTGELVRDFASGLMCQSQLSRKIHKVIA